MAEYPPAPRSFLVPGLLSHRKATRALNGHQQSPLLFPGLGNVPGPRKGAVGSRVRGSPSLCSWGLGPVLANAVSSTGARKGRRKPRMLPTGSRAAFTAPNLVPGSVYRGLLLLSLVRPAGRLASPSLQPERKGLGSRELQPTGWFQLPALSSRTNGNLC